MSSTDRGLPNLNRDLPTTPEDVEALRRLRHHRTEDPFAAVQALVDALPSAARRQRRTTAEGRPDFEL